MKLRWYQEEAVDAVFSDWDSGTQRTALVLPCGAGKTIIFSNIVSTLVRQERRRPLILCDRDELVDQAVAKLKAVDPALSVGIIKAERHEVRADVCVGSIQTMHRRLGKGAKGISSDRFTDLICDEAHLSAAQTWINTMKHFGVMSPDSGSRALGVTATLMRGDGTPLGHIWEKVAYEVSIQQLMSEGYLVPAHAERAVLDELDLSKIKTLGGDWSEVALGTAMFRSGAKIAEQLKEKAAGPDGRIRRTIVFAPTIACARQWAEEFNDFGIRSRCVFGITPKSERHEIYGQLDRHEIDAILSVAVLTTGFDLPSVEVAVMGRPTKSLVLYTQAIGRVLRPSPSTGKTSALVLDVCGVMNEKLRTLVDLGLPKACDCACACDFAHLCPQACNCPRSKKGKLKRPCVLCAKTWRDQPKAEREPCLHYVAGHVVGCKHRCDGIGRPGEHPEDEDEEILDPEAPEPKEMIIDESDITTTTVDLFDLTTVPGPRKAPTPKVKPKAWRMTYSGRHYLPSTTTFEYWIFLHQDNDGTWSVGELSKERKSRAQRIGQGLTLAAAVALAEDNHPSGGWLGRPLAGLPSEGQLSTLKGRGIPIPQGCTRQQASDLLSDLFASAALD